MVAMINEIGNRYGRLIVISLIGRIGKERQSWWLCKCDCGNTKIVRGNSLRRGHTTSCGCFAKEVVSTSRRLPSGDAAFNSYYRKAQRTAYHRQLEWKLDKNAVRKITSSPCFYCGKTPSQVVYGNGNRSYYGTYIYNGIDRVDNEKGYIHGNVVPCCGQCNIAKSTYSFHEFVEWIQRVYNHLCPNIPYNK